MNSSYAADGYIELFAAMIAQLGRDLRLNWNGIRTFEDRMDALKYKNDAWQYVTEDPDFVVWLECAGIDPIAGRQAVIDRAGPRWNYKWGELIRKWMPYSRVPAGRPKGPRPYIAQGADIFDMVKGATA